MLLRSLCLSLLILVLQVGAVDARQTADRSVEPRPLTVKEAEALTDPELVSRAFHQLAAKVIQVRRPVASTLGLLHSPPYFSSLDLVLRPKASPGIRGVCEAELITVGMTEAAHPERWPDLRRAEWRPSLLGPEDDPAKLAAAADPAMSAGKVSSATVFKIVGRVEQFSNSGSDAVTAAACTSLSSIDGFFAAPEAWSIWQALWLVEQAKREIAARQLQVECLDKDPKCEGVLQRLRPDRITGIGQCPEFDPSYVVIPQDSICVSLRYHEEGGPTSFTSREVNVIASMTGDGKTWKGDVTRVLVSTRMTVVD